jgi:hypothetical protein
MKRIIVLFIVFLLTLNSCKHVSSTNFEIALLKNFYRLSQPLSIHPVCLDSINSILSIATILDSICLTTNEWDQTIGIVYNLKDSLFTPSKDSINNIVIPCGIGNPMHARLAISSYSSLITSISADSLTFFNERTQTQTRVNITSFENFFKEYLNKYNINKLPSDEYVAVSIDISSNPHKESFKIIFEDMFWAYYSEVIASIKENPKIDMDDVLAKSQKDPSIIRDLMAPIVLKLIRYDPEQHLQYQVLTPRR